MSKRLRVEVELDLAINEDETSAGVLRDLMEGMSQGDPDVARLLSIRAHEVEEYEPEDARPCRCMDVIG